MRKRQPDNRIHPGNLGMVTLGNRRFVINLRSGVPFNACIEESSQGALRCWASHNWLDDRAATIVGRYANETPKGSFIWKDEVKRGSRACTKGGHELFRVIFP